MQKLLLIILFASLLWSCNLVTKDAPPPEQQALEFGEMKYGNICHEQLKQLSRGNMDDFINNFADNVIYRFNNGDSIIGKNAVAEYWRDRRNNVIDKIEFYNDIWLPLKVNDSSQDMRMGMWVLGWYKTSSTYKTGKSMNQFIHTMYHFNEQEKIDEVIQYYDRLPIMQATTR